MKRSCALELKERHGVIEPDQFSLIIHRPSPDLLKAETNLHRLLGLDIGQTHDVIKYALLRMSGISERFGIMERYTALTDLNNIDLPVFEGRYEFFADQIAANRDKRRLNRVLEIQDFPDFKAIAAEGRLRLDKILEIRETQECGEFRTWLKQIDRLSDEEIRDQIESFRSAVGNFMGGTTGKTIRLLVSNGVGVIPAVGPLVGLAASVVDSFLVDKLFPSSGPISFINRRLPSVFELGGKKQELEVKNVSQST